MDLNLVQHIFPNINVTTARLQYHLVAVTGWRMDITECRNMAVSIRMALKVLFDDRVLFDYVFQSNPEVVAIQRWRDSIGQPG